MQKMTPAASPDAYVGALNGWRRELVEALRSAVRGAGTLEEVIKWGNVVYLANGPVLMIRAEAERVLFGFWRGQRLLAIEPRLKPGGKYEMATLELRKGMTIQPATVRRLTREAIAINEKAGDPSLDAKPDAARAKPRAATRTPRGKRAPRSKRAPTGTPTSEARPMHGASWPSFR